MAEDAPIQHRKPAGVPATSLPPPLLIKPHPPPRLHQRRLCRCVRSLQRVPEGGVLQVCEPVGSVSLQCRELPDQRREAAGCVPSNILRVLGYYLAHTRCALKASVPES